LWLIFTDAITIGLNKPVYLKFANMLGDKSNKRFFRLFIGTPSFLLAALAVTAAAGSETAMTSDGIGTQKTVAIAGAAVIIMVDILLVVLYRLRKQRQKMQKGAGK